MLKRRGSTNPLNCWDHVTILGSKPEVPERYRTLGRSGLMIEVKEGDNVFDFELVAHK
jgi:hypothetical protein